MYTHPRVPHKNFFLILNSNDLCLYHVKAINHVNYSIINTINIL